MGNMEKLCPHCGKQLPAQAHFCLFCAQSVQPRQTVCPPRILVRIAPVKIVLAVILAAMAALGAFLAIRPKNYDSYGQVIYTDEDGTYQLVLATANDRFTPLPEIQAEAERDQTYRLFSRLCINHMETGANAGQIFLQKADRVRVEFLQPEDSPSPMVCSAPAPADFAPEAALVSSLDFTGRSSSAQLLWTLEMKNGDTIRLRQDLVITPIRTWEFSYTDYPMDTVEELQALIDRIGREIAVPDVVNLYLPPVVYEGGITLENRPINLYGSQEAGMQTTFTDTVQVTCPDSGITNVNGINFLGGDGEAGVLASARFRAEACRFSGWKTGVLGHGEAWVNVNACEFANNQVGIHLNSAGTGAAYTQFQNNIFTENETGVLLENPPTEVALDFGGCVFRGNGTDIDNRSNQPIKISQAVME